MVRTGAAASNYSSSLSSVEIILNGKRMIVYGEPPFNVAIKSTPDTRVLRGTPGVAAEIRHYQNSTNQMIARAPFARLIHELSRQYADFVFQPSALDALQEAAESYLVETLEASKMLAIHRSRVTIAPKDIKLVSKLMTSNR
ncbi:histone H3 [Pseudolycoriella hygida]|uniref:Histone H3 n=1 Tax=Pseudolycoriella hygida TaxID=35572 RepID=A0A9Q0NHT3_9DIPT|nr:histone H3 [Pseudolycoriella hygida]